MEEELENLRKDYEDACEDVRLYVIENQHLRKENFLQTIATLSCLTVAIFFAYMYNIFKDKEKFCG